MLIALFFSSVLMFKKGYSYIPVTLGVISIIYLFVYLFKFKKKWILAREEKIFIISLLCYFLVYVLSVIFNGDGLRVIDNPSRILLFIPLILLLSQFKINIKMLIHAIPVGSAVTGLIAVFQKFILDYPIAFIEFMIIQAGDIAMSLGSLSLVISLYLAIKKQYKIAVLYFLFSCLGMYASVLTQTRGAAISLIITLPLIFSLYYKQLNKKFVVTSGIGLIVVGILAVSTSTAIKDKFNMITTQIENYIEYNDASTSVGARLDMWKGTLLAVKEKPVLGWGDNGYGELKKELAQKGLIAHNTVHFSTEHNQYLDTLAKRGIIGFISLLAIFVIPLIYFAKHLRVNDITKCFALIGIVHVVSAMIYCLTQSFLTHNSGSIFYFFLLIIFYCVIKDVRTKA